MERLSKRCLVVPSLALYSLLLGCASQGPLRPPSLHLPAAVRHLDAKRVGGMVQLNWTNPTKTSDGEMLTAKRGAGALTAELCRKETPQTLACTPFQRLPVNAGAITTVTDTLPPDLGSGVPRSLYYSVRVVNARNKGAAWTQAVTAAGAAPEPLRSLQAQPIANGVLLRWEPGEDGILFRVSRGADEAKSTLLRVSGVRSPDGTVDTGGRAGQEQRYTGFRQRIVSLAGQSVMMESAPASVTVAANARLPLPNAPTALEAVANTLTTPEVDLVWQPSDDASVSGYRVYRQEGAGEPVLLTPQPLSGFTFTDRTAQSGHRYTYRVSAINLSGESSAVTTTATLP